MRHVACCVPSVCRPFCLQGELAVLESRLFELAGRRFNLSSRQQLSQVIFQELGVRARDQQYSVPRTKATGMESTKEVGRTRADCASLA